MNKKKWNIINRLGALLLALFVSLGIFSGCGNVVQDTRDNMSAEATVDLLASREEAETESDTDPPVSTTEASIATSEKTVTEAITEATTEAASELSSEAIESHMNASSEEVVIGQVQHFVLYEDGTYTSKEDVADYIHEFGHLPGNFITKKEAQRLGWTGGSLEKYAPGKSIGGDYFGNYEGLLPTKKGRKYYECDIDTLGQKNRGAKRIVFSNDGLIFYTEDHYESYELIYGDTADWN